jgi:class 3 adenylate cyclase
MKQDIANRLSELLKPGDYTVYDTGPIPGAGDTRLTFDSTGVRFDAVTLYIDMRGSTAVLNAHQAHNVAKIHKAYLFTATKLVAEGGGQIRSYNGDSILAFFPGKGKAAVTPAIKASMQIKHILTEVCAQDFARYKPVDFGIGIEAGSILCAKAGMGRNDNHNDLIWLGNAVNRATVLSDKGRAPNHIWISDAVRNLLENNVQYGGSPPRDIWSADWIDYNGARERAWYTQFHWSVE